MKRRKRHLRLEHRDCRGVEQRRPLEPPATVNDPMARHLEGAKETRRTLEHRQQMIDRILVASHCGQRLGHRRLARHPPFEVSGTRLATESGNLATTPRRGGLRCRSTGASRRDRSRPSGRVDRELDAR